MNKKIFKSLMLLSLISILAFSLMSCSSNDSAKSENKEKTELTLQFVPTNNDGTMEASAKPFAEYLTEKLGMPVKVTLATDYSTIVEAMSSGKVDIGIMPPAAYIQAKNQGYATAILTSELGAFDRETGLPIKGEKRGSFKGEILVKADSDMKSLQDLKGKRIATLSPNSASGFIYPAVEMKKAGIDPMKDVTLSTVNDIPSEITAVLLGQVDACFVFEGARVVFNGKFADKDLMKELKVLYLTEGDIPNDAIAVLPDLSDELKEKIKTAFLEMPNDEKGAAAMKMWGHQSYTEANDDNYTGVDKYTKEAAEL